MIIIILSMNTLQVEQARIALQVRKGAFSNAAPLSRFLSEFACNVGSTGNRILSFSLHRSQSPRASGNFPSSCNFPLYHPFGEDPVRFETALTVAGTQRQQI